MSFEKQYDLVFYKNGNTALSVHDKVHVDDYSQLDYLFNKYVNEIVKGGSIHTLKAKEADIKNFKFFYYGVVRSFNKDFWVPAITKYYQKYLTEEKKLKPASVNRKIATIRHAASWMLKNSYIKLNPMEGVHDIEFLAVGYKGLSNKEVTRLKAACDIRRMICRRKDQNPLLETTIFYVLLHTGLRESELCTLNYHQYNGKGFENVKRKGNRVTGFVALHTDARNFLDQYLAIRGGNIEPNDPLFINIRRNRISPDDVYYACNQIKKQANAMLSKDEQIVFTPHSLRHAFLKRVADKWGIHAALEFSGNVSIKEIYRYTRPSSEEMNNIVHECF